jgi:hypothetical protein
MFILLMSIKNNGTPSAMTQPAPGPLTQGSTWGTLVSLPSSPHWQSGSPCQPHHDITHRSPCDSFSVLDYGSLWYSCHPMGGECSNNRMARRNAHAAREHRDSGKAHTPGSYVIL